MEEIKKRTQVINKIKDNYQNLDKSVISEMDILSDHCCITGDNREVNWLKFFRRIIPHKFSLEQGVLIIDSKGRISKEIDIAVVDKQYTPYIFKYNEIKFIPIEAVAVVIESKSLNPDKENLKKWVESIDCLETSSTGIARMATGYFCANTNDSQKRTLPIKILASLKTLNKDTSSNFVKDLLGKFHFIITRQKENNSTVFKLDVHNSDNKLGYWANELNGTNKDDLNIFRLDGDLKKDGVNIENGKLKNTLDDLEISDNPILTLNFQLNQLLMLINNPMLFPHFAYARLFENPEEIIKNNC